MQPLHLYHCMTPALMLSSACADLLPLACLLLLLPPLAASLHCLAGSGASTPALTSFSACADLLPVLLLLLPVASTRCLAG